MLDLQLFLGRPLLLPPLPEDVEPDVDKTAIVFGSVPRSLLEDDAEDVRKKIVESVDLVRASPLATGTRRRQLMPTHTVPQA